VQGESYMFDVRADQSRTSPRTSYVAITEGTVRVTRIQGRLEDERTVGHTSSKSQWRPEVPVPNKLLFTTITPVHKYLCVMREDNGVVRVIDRDLESGQTYTVPPGTFGVLAVGAAARDGVPIGPYHVIEEGQSVQAAGDGVLVLEVSL
jgi:hypothetical protein